MRLLHTSANAVSIDQGLGQRTQEGSCDFMDGECGGGNAEDYFRDLLCNLVSSWSLGCLVSYTRIGEAQPAREVTRAHLYHLLRRPQLVHLVRMLNADASMGCESPHRRPRRPSRPLRHSSRRATDQGPLSEDEFGTLSPGSPAACSYILAVCPRCERPTTDWANTIRTERKAKKFLMVVQRKLPRFFPLSTDA